MTVPYTRLCIY